MSNAYERVLLSQALKHCSVCSRQFSSDRIKTHEIICQKSSINSRKPFDVSQQRLKGTDVNFLPASRRNNGQIKAQKSGLSTNWRWKHEDFIRNIRAIKKCNEKRSKKQNDLPTMPPAEFSECFQCPYCSTELNKLAVESHLSLCLTENSKKSKSKGSLTKNLKSKTSQTSTNQK